MSIISIVPSSGTGSCSRNEIEPRKISALAPVLARSVVLSSLISTVNAGVAGSQNGTLGSTAAISAPSAVRISPAPSLSRPALAFLTMT